MSSVDSFEVAFKEIIQNSANRNGELYVKKYLQDLKKYSQTTYNHSVNVSAQIFYALKKSTNPTFSSEEILKYTRGALLHDVGKLKIPKHILHGENLSAEEYSIMMQHSIDGINEAKERDFDKISQFIGITHHIDASSLENNFVGAEESRHQWKDVYFPGEIQEKLSEFKTMSKKDFLVAKMVTFYDIVEALRSKDRAYQQQHNWIEDAKYIDKNRKECNNFSVKSIMNAKLPKEDSTRYEVGSEFKGLVEQQDFQQFFDNIQNANYPMQVESWLQENVELNIEDIDFLLKNTDHFLEENSLKSEKTPNFVENYESNFSLDEINC